MCYLCREKDEIAFITITISHLTNPCIIGEVVPYKKWPKDKNLIKCHEYFK